MPQIVISPYAKPGYISHVDHDFGSILNFIEQAFRLHSLDYADAHTPHNLSDRFNFDQAPREFKAIEASDADYFINDTRVPDDPDTE